jgi:hypothetical protein
MNDRTHVDLGSFFSRIWRIVFFFSVAVGYKTLYLIVRTSLLNHFDHLGAQPMDKWVVADLDNIILDFMGQLRSATEQGWQRTKPDHYRSILMALESALNERRELVAHRARQRPEGLVNFVTERQPAAAVWPLGLRGLLLRPLLCLVPSRGQCARSARLLPPY